MKTLLSLAALIGLGGALSGCVVAAAAGAGYLIHDEATECDEKFDPLEDVRGKEDGCN